MEDNVRTELISKFGPIIRHLEGAINSVSSALEVLEDEYGVRNVRGDVGDLSALLEVALSTASRIQEREQHLLVALRNLNA